MEECPRNVEQCRETRDGASEGPKVEQAQPEIQTYKYQPFFTVFKKKSGFLNSCKHMFRMVCTEVYSSFFIVCKCGFIIIYQMKSTCNTLKGLL